MTAGPLDPGTWRRLGRGRTVDVALDAAQGARLLADGPPARHAPYRVVAMRLVDDGTGRHRPANVEIAPAELPDWYAGGCFQFFLGSDPLSPWLAGALATAPASLLATNGLVVLQFPGVRSPMLGIVDKVRDDATGEERVHADYLAVYRALVSAARRLS